MTDTIEDIRARHQIDAKWCGWWSHDRKQQHDDRGTLLAEVDRLREEIAAMRRYIDRTNREDYKLSTALHTVTRERDEARAALKPFSNMYLWPDDAGPVTAQRVRSRNGWDEAANDEESHEFWIKRGDIRAARKALEAKP